MVNTCNLFFILSSLSCSAYDLNEVGNILNNNPIDSALKANRDKSIMVVSLKDTTYYFLIYEINTITFSENKTMSYNGCVFGDLNINITGQSYILFNDTLMSFNTGGLATAVSINSRTKTLFYPECVDFQPHCNVANYHFRNNKKYVYLSEWDRKHRCFVEELLYDSNNNSWTSKLRQIISLEIDDSIRGKGNMDWIVDTDHNMLYVQTYKDGTSKDATGLVYLQFHLPPITEEKEILLKADQIIRRVEHPMIYITQDKEIYKDKLYILSGLGGKYPGKITVIDLKDFEDEEVYELSYINDEPEGISFYKDNLFVFYWSQNYSIQNKKSMFIHLKNGVCLSYPITEIREISFY